MSSHPIILRRKVTSGESFKNIKGHILAKAGFHLYILDSLRSVSSLCLSILHLCSTFPACYWHTVVCPMASHSLSLWERAKKVPFFFPSLQIPKKGDRVWWIRMKDKISGSELLLCMAGKSRSCYLYSGDDHIDLTFLWSWERKE